MRPFTSLLLAIPLLGAFPAAQASSGPAHRAPPVIPDISAWVQGHGWPGPKAWRHAAKVSIATEIEPGHDLPAPVKTLVSIGYTQRNLWLRFIAEDPHPENIRIKYRTHDNLNGNDDYVGLLFSPFNDPQWGYEFFCNAGGTEMDAYRQQGNEYTSFDAIWSCRAHVTSHGYVVTIKLPLSSIKFPHSAHPQHWRMLFFRNWARNVRHQIADIHFDYNNNCLLCQARVFRTATPIQSRGSPLQIIPAATVQQTDQRPDPASGLQHGSPQVKGGLDARWTIRPDLEWSATLNPTFSEVAPDVLQPTFNRRFAINYPENRPFFKQGTWVFNTVADLVDTRQIADPHWATKLVGQIGAHALGVLVANDSLTNILLPGQQSSQLQSFDFSTRDALMRYRFDTSGDNSVGVLATGRKGGGYDNGVLAFDGNWKIDPSDSISAQVVHSTTAYPQQVAGAFGIQPGTVTGNAWIVKAARTRTNYNASISISHVDPGFRADLGLVPQVGYTDVSPYYEYDWYSNTAWWNNGGFGALYDWTDASGGGPVLDRKIRTYAFVHGLNQTHFIFYATHEDQYYSGSTFSLNDFELDSSAQPLPWLQGEVDIVGGDGVDYTGVRKGGLVSIAPSFSLTPGSHFEAQLVGNFERLNVTGGRLYTADLYDIRLAWHFNARLFVRAIAQEQNIRRNVALYPAGTSSQSRTVASQWLVGYVINPFTALYAGYSNGYLGTGDMGLQTQQRTLFIKLSYDFQI